MNEVSENTIRAYKAFDRDMKCRGYQFEAGKTYDHDGPVRACESGFHACENPLDVWNYYPLDSRYAVVELGGDASRHDGDSKIAAARITISAEIALPQIISDGVAYLMGLCKNAFALKPGKDKSGDFSQLAASGYRSQLAASGENCVCVAASPGAIARAGERGAIALTYHDGERYRIAVAYVGEDGIEPNVDYRVTNTGEFVVAMEGGHDDEARLAKAVRAQAAIAQATGEQS